MFAEQNVKDNDLESRIIVVGVDAASKTIIPTGALERFERCIEPRIGSRVTESAPELISS